LPLIFCKNFVYSSINLLNNYFYTLNKPQFIIISLEFATLNLGESAFMSKYIIILLSATLFFTACTERGYKIHPKHRIHRNIAKVHTTQTAKKAQEKTTVSKPTVITTVKLTEDKPTPILPKTIVIEEQESSTLSDETKNNISGFFVLLISLIILF